MNPTPRQFFRQNHKADAAALAVLLNEPWFQRSVVAAAAEMSRRATQPQMDGAHEFMATLNTLTEDDRSADPVPDHSHLKTYSPQPEK